ncbi:MAG: hypothetical protein GX333_08380 [Syntrophomonadaceae bacterium]|nr:hypothetical protein [Syntrophomonadaceae bacterium]
MERACIDARDEYIKPENLLRFNDRNVFSTDNKVNLNEIRDKAERNAIMNVLKKTNGNKSEAAKILGISRSTLYVKLKQFNLA